ncbi:MAG TPA: glycosyltransferase [Polyangiaceae bacterium]|nr:glycosyltransferase [Polyangiaceae bacterium]
MSQLSIAHVLSSFGIGGQERVALDLARQQRAAGHRVLAISLAPAPDGPLAAVFQAADVPTETLPKRGPSVDPSLPMRLSHVLFSHGCDLVHTHNPHALIYGAPAAALAHVASVHTKHGVNPDADRRLWLRRTASRFVDAYVAVTQSLSEIAVEKQECDPERLHVIPNGIDVQRFAPNPEARRRVRAQLGIDQDAWILGSVGRLAAEKNQQLLIDAVAPMLDQRRHLVLVGDGPERSALESRTATTLRSDYVHFLGARDDVQDLLVAFDAFALTSHSEGLPLVVLEAMASELPVVATAVGGLPDVIDDELTGYLVAAGDSVGLMRRFAWLSTRPLQAQRVASCARQLVTERHSLVTMTGAYESLYRKTLARSGKHQRLSVGAGRA